ncbi:MAG: hypothetical protein V3T17_12285 [Pseudomonadales bacterium]
MKVDKEKHTELTPEQKQQALALLTDKNLIQRISDDIKKIGVIGEESNALVSYLACVSRKLEKPLAVMIQPVIEKSNSNLSMTG